LQLSEAQVEAIQGGVKQQSIDHPPQPASVRWCVRCRNDQ